MHSIFFLFACLFFYSSLAQPEYATLHAVRTGDASSDLDYHNAYQLSVDEQKKTVLMRLSGKHSKALLYAPLCDSESLPEEREFTFNDETLTDPTRSAAYRLEVDYDCQKPSDGTMLQANGEIGVRTRDSPLWRIWSYATFSADEIRVGRKHPRNTSPATWDKNNFECQQSLDENVCQFEAAVGDETFLVDFQVEDSHIYLPHSLYMHYTSPRWAKRLTIKRVEDWPPLVLNTTTGAALVLDARLFVPYAFEQSLTKPDTDADWPAFVAQALQEANVLVASNDPHRIMLGTRLLERYTLQRDYIGARMNAMHAPVVDHFSLLQSIFLIFLFTVYIGHKASTMEYITILAIGEWPRCHICNKNITYEICASHITTGSRVVQRLRELLLFLISWISLALDARLNHSGSLSVWAYASLAVATVLFVVINIVEINCSLEWGVAAVRRLFIVRCASFELAAAIGMISLASVVRVGSSFITGMLFFVANLIIYDSMRRTFVILVTRSLPGPISIWWIVYVLIINIGLGLIYTTIVLTKYIIWPFMDCGWVFTIASIFSSLFLSFTVISSYMRRAMTYSLNKTNKE